jgi:PII-like signaling protein
MTLQGEGKLLRIFIGESDRWQHKPLYEEIARAARSGGLAGATVIRGIEGFGASSHLHTTRILRLSEDLPLVIEIVDTAEKIDAFLSEIDPMIADGLVTVERVEVRAYRASSRRNRGT